MNESGDKIIQINMQGELNISKNKTRVVVYTPKPELTIYRDTYLKCELISKLDDRQYRLKVISVHTGKGGLLGDLTAERVDEIFQVSARKVYYSLDEMHQAIQD